MPSVRMVSTGLQVIQGPQVHGTLGLPEVPVRPAPPVSTAKMVTVVRRVLQAILVQLATTATTVRRALQAILVQMATTVRRALQAILVQTATLARRAIKAIKVTRVIRGTKVLTVSRPQIRVLPSHWLSLQRPPPPVQQPPPPPQRDRLEPRAPQAMTELLPRFLVQLVRRDPQEALVARDALAVLAVPALH